MKRKIVLGIFAGMAVFAAACSGETEPSERGKSSQAGEKNDTTTILEYRKSHHTDCSTPFAENEDGYYFYDGETEQICYYEKNENVIVPLCSKTDCDHTSKNCNAHVAGMSDMTLTLAGEKLYYAAQQNGEAAIYSTAADGTGGVEKLVTLCQVYGDSYGVTDGIFAEGYLYYIENEIAADTDRESYNLYRIKVESGAEPELLYEEDDEECSYNVLCYLKAEGENIFFSNMVLKEETYYGQIKRYDTQKGTVENVFSYEDGNTYNGRYEVAGQNLYLVKVGGTVELYDMDTEELSTFYQDETGAETNCEIEFDGTYFYLDNCVDGFISLDQSKRQINVRNLKGELVESIALPDLCDEVYCAFDNGLVYESYEVGEDGGVEMRISFAEKNQIGSGKVEFQEALVP